MPDELETAHAQITKLTEELGTAKSGLASLTTAHTTLAEQHETSKSNLVTAQSELKTLSDSSKSSVKIL